MLIAQAMVEYGVLSALVDTVASTWRAVTLAMRDPSVAVPVWGALMVLGYFLVRRR